MENEIHERIKELLVCKMTNEQKILYRIHNDYIKNDILNDNIMERIKIIRSCVNRIDELKNIIGNEEYSKIIKNFKTTSIFNNTYFEVLGWKN